MKVTLSFERGISDDVSIMVDALRASTTITLALDNFKRVIPCSSFDEAIEVKSKYGGVVAGERGGKQIEGCDIGNTPCGIKNYESSSDTLILTTSNGTRILENMTSKVLVGAMVNAKAVALKSIELADAHVDVVMAGVKGQFAIEDFLAAGEIIHEISKNCRKCELSEYAKASVLAIRNHDAANDAFMNSRTAKRLIELSYEDDVELCSLKNISDNVAIYRNHELTLYI